MIKKTNVTVKVQRLGAEAVEVTVKKGATAEDAVAEAGLLKKDTETIHINKKESAGTTPVKHGDIIVLSKNVAGGQA